MSRFINNTATYGASWYILFASISTINHDDTHKGIQWQDVNATFNDRICGENNLDCSYALLYYSIYALHAGNSMDCYPPQPPVNGNVYNYTTTLEGSQATYKCDNGFIPSGEFKTTCIQFGQWFPNPMELTCSYCCS